MPATPPPAIDAPGPPDRPVISGEIRVCWFGLESPPGDLPKLERLLSRAELEQADRFRFARDRERWVTAHVTLRRILARLVRRTPGELTFAIGHRGKPALPLGARAEPIYFNLSRSGDLALVAVARDGEVGVDVELIRPSLDVLAIARRMFAAEEYGALVALPEEERLPAFLRYWSRKEAVVKALGEGLSFPLQSFVLACEPRNALEAIRLGHEGREMPLWVRILPPPRPGYTAAVASTFAPAVVRLERWEDPA